MRRASAAIALLLALNACQESGPTAPPEGVATLVVRAAVSGTAIATIVVAVTAPDIAAALVFDIPITNGVATGVLTVPAGSARTIAMSAYDAGGVETHSGSATVNIQPATNPTLSIVLTPLAGSVPVTVTLGSITVTVAPALTGLTAGDTATLTATILDSVGGPIADSVTWATLSPSHATVVSTGPRTGRVTARSPGQTVVVAMYAGVAGPASIIVTNAPTGWGVINDYDMHAINDGGWNNAYASDIDTGISVISDATAPLSPPAVWQFSYPIGTGGGTAPATEYLTWAGSTDVYFGFWWKASNPWQGHSSDVNKIVEFFDNNAFFGSYFYKMVGSGSGPFRTQVTIESDVPTINYNENQDQTPITLGVWHFCEIVFQRSNGTVRWWLDGKLKGSYSGVHYGGTQFVQAEVYPGWGGTDDTKTENDFYWFDHVHIAGSP